MNDPEYFFTISGPSKEPDFDMYVLTNEGQTKALVGYVSTRGSLREGDLVEVVTKLTEKCGMVLTIEHITRDGRMRTSEGGWWRYRTSFKLISRASVPVQATPVQHSPNEPKLKKDEFSERGVLPSDVAGINEMVKRMFKEKRDETAPAPAKPKSHAGLLITASEKYLGLGYNDTMGRP